jgi:hypothetical protein
MASKTAVLRLRMAEVAALRVRGTGVETLRGLVPDGRPMGHDLTSDYAFLAVDASGAYPGVLREVTRSFVFLPGPGALVACDVAVAADQPVAVSWNLEGNAKPASVARILPRTPGAAPAADSILLHVIWLGERQPLAALDSSDLAGVRVADRVVAFFTETRTARSAVSFDVDGPAMLKFLITGLAPGEWEIWRGGLLENLDGTVPPEKGALAFQDSPGNYFLRRIGS